MLYYPLFKGQPVMIKTCFNILLIVYGLVCLPSSLLGDPLEEQKAAQPCFLSRNLFPGDKNMDVMKLEVYLEFVLNRHIVPNQFFDEETSNLLKQLQQENGLKSTGVLDEQTRTAILPCPVSGHITLLTPKAGELRKYDSENHSSRQIHFSWENTLQFPKQSTTLFDPQIVVGLKKDESSEDCGPNVNHLPMRNGNDNTSAWVELQPANGKEWISHSWSPCPQGDGYRATIAVLPAAIGNIPTTRFKAVDFIHPDYVHLLLSDVSDETFSLSETEK